MKVLDPDPAPTERPVPLDREWLNDREIDVFGGLMFLWRLRYALLTGLVLGAGLGTAYSASRPREFTATASLMVTNPPVMNDAAPRGISIDAVDQVAISASIRDQVVAELARRGSSGEEEILQRRTVVHTAASAEHPTLSMLGLSVVATSPALARDAANLWAEVLEQQVGRIELARRGDASKILGEDYPKASAALTDHERQLAELKRAHQNALERVRGSAAISLKEAELASRERLVVELAEQRRRLAVTMKESAAGVAALESELKQLTGTDATAVRTSLMEKLVDARVRSREAAARDEALALELEQVRRAAAAARTTLSQATLEISSLELRQETELFAREREVALARAVVDDLEMRLGAAQVVATLPQSTISRGPAAELPAGPSGPSLTRPVITGAAAGLAFAFIAGWFVVTARRRGVALR